VGEKDNTLQRVARDFAGWLFLPVDVDYQKAFKLPLQLLIIVFIVVVCILATPPVVDYLLAANWDIFPLNSIRSNPKAWGRWLPFVSIVLEFSLALLVGGSVFGEWLASNSKDAIANLQNSAEAARRHDMVDANDNLEVMIREYRTLFADITVRNFLPRMWHLYLLSRRILRFLTRDIPKVNAHFLVTKLGVAFPGGFYGVMAFSVFGLLSLVKVSGLYCTQVIGVP